MMLRPGILRIGENTYRKSGRALNRTGRAADDKW
jgi:hypothetical protein